MTHTIVPQCVDVHDSKLRKFQLWPLFSADLLKYNQTLPDNLHDLSLCEQTRWDQRSCTLQQQKHIFNIPGEFANELHQPISPLICMFLF